MGRKASAILETKVTGLSDMDKMLARYAGWNQALELGKKGLDLITKAAGAAMRATKALVGTGSMFENYNVQWETLLGSVGEAEKRMKSLFAFATRTPFKLPEVIDAAKTMEAFGIYSERALSAVGDMASAFGKTFNDTALAIAGAATGEMERLKVFGITTATVMAHTGEKINRSTIEGQKKVVQAVMEIFEERAGGGMDRMSKTFSGMMSMFSDKWMAFKKIVDDAGFFDTVRTVFGTLLESVDKLFASGEVEAVAATIGQTMSKLFLRTVDTMLIIAIKVAELVDSVNKWMEENDPAAKAKSAAKGWQDFWGWVPGRPRAEREEAAFQAYAPAFGSARYMQEQRGSENPFISELEKLREEMSNLITASGFTPLGPRRPEGAATAVQPDTGVAYQGPFAPAGYQFPGEGSFAGQIGGVRGETADPGVYGGPAVVPDMDPVKDAHERSIKEMTERGTEMWEIYYDNLFKLGAKFGSLEKITLKGILSATKQAAKEMLSVFVARKSKEAGIEALESAARAIKAAAGYDFVSAAKYTAAALAFGALAVTGTVVAGALAGTGEPEQVEVTNAGEFGGTGTAGGTTRLSQTSTIRSQNLNVTVQFNAGVQVIGDEGTERFMRETVWPSVHEGIEQGAI